MFARSRRVLFGGLPQFDSGTPQVDRFDAGHLRISRDDIARALVPLADLLLKPGDGLFALVDMSGDLRS